MTALSENLIAYYEANVADPTADSWGSLTVRIPGQLRTSEPIPSWAGALTYVQGGPH